MIADTPAARRGTTRRRGLAPAAAVLVMSLAGVGLSACGGDGEAPAATATTAAPSPAAPSSAPAPGVTVTGVLRVHYAQKTSTTSLCLGSGRFVDIRSSTRVELRDEADAVLGKTILGKGTYDGDRTCTFEFEIPRVREDAQRYELGISLRYKYPKTQAELSAAGWRYEVDLGG